MNKKKNISTEKAKSGLILSIKDHKIIKNRNEINISDSGAGSGDNNDK